MKPLGYTGEAPAVEKIPNNLLSNSRKFYFTTKHFIIPERDTYVSSFNYLDVNESALEDRFCVFALFSMTLLASIQSALDSHLTCKRIHFHFPEKLQIAQLKGVRFSFGIISHHTLPRSR